VKADVKAGGATSVVPGVPAVLFTGTEADSISDRQATAQVDAMKHP
jgi:hypothetical protein